MKRIVALIDDIYEDLELWYPKIRLEEEGWAVVVAGPEKGREYRGKHGYPCKADAAIDDIETTHFDALLVPGGFAPDKLRRLEHVKDLVRRFDEEGKVIAFICHAGWVLVSAEVLRGRRATSTVGIRDDMLNAGTVWVDEPLVIDGNLVSARTPADLAHFARGMVEQLKRLDAVAAVRAQPAKR